MRKQRRSNSEAHALPLPLAMKWRQNLFHKQVKLEGRFRRSRLLRRAPTNRRDIHAILKHRSGLSIQVLLTKRHPELTARPQLRQRRIRCYWRNEIECHQHIAYKDDKPTLFWSLSRQL